MPCFLTPLPPPTRAFHFPRVSRRPRVSPRALPPVRCPRSPPSSHAPKQGAFRIFSPLLQQPDTPTDRPPKPRKPAKPPDAYETPRLNRILASRRISLVFLVVASLAYVVAVCLLARTLSLAAPGYQRVLLLGAGILLPDFRHVLRAYADAVQSLQSYKPAFGLRIPTKQTAVPREEKAVEPPPWGDKPELKWLSDAVSHFQDAVQQKLDASATHLDEVWTNLSRDVAKPIVETGTQIQQLTTGTDLTLRKNVIVAAASITLSLVGYVACALGEVSVGGVVIMLASMLPSALLAPKRHELLALIDDARVGVALAATLCCVLSVFFPLVAAYCFLVCCVALVAMRHPNGWI